MKDKKINPDKHGKDFFYLIQMTTVYETIYAF